MSDRESLQPAALNQSADRTAAARSRVYALLGEAFTYPRGESVLRLLEGDWLSELEESGRLAHPELTYPADLHLPGSRDAIQILERRYSDLFDVHGAAPTVSLLERAYGNEPEQKLWQELLSFYRHFGLDFSKGYAEEQPDHLLTELAFMHYLCFLEAGASIGWEDYRRGQRDFLNRHLANWVESAAARIDAASESERVYAELADILVRFIRAETIALNDGAPGSE